MNNIFLDGKNLYLRPLEEQDISEMYLKGINDQTRDIYTDHALYPKNLYSLREFSQNKSRSGDIWLGVFLKSNNEHIGNLEIFNIEMVHRKADYSIIIWSHESKGYGFESSFLLLNHVFTKLNLNRISLSVNSQNKAAINLYKKLGFIEEGIQREAFIRDNKRFDFINMGLLLNDFLFIKNKIV